MSRVEESSVVRLDPNVQAVASLPSDLAIMRLENENIMSLAAARPRDHKKIREDLLAQIDAYPSFARDVIYSKPVGKDQQGRMQYARGLSVRAAEAIAEAYGFCRVRCEVSPLDETTVKVEATFTDYQRGRIWQDAGILSKFYRARGGQMVRHPEDRFYSLVVKAEASRRIREVILRSVPPGLRSELMELAERKIDELLDDSTIQKIVGKFASKAITLEQLETHIGRSLKAGWTKEDRRDLLGLWNAIDSGETTVAEAFGTGQAEAAKAAPPAGNGNLTGQDLATARVAAEPPPPNPEELVTADFVRDLGAKIREAQTEADYLAIGAELAKAREWLGEPRYAALAKTYQEAQQAWRRSQAAEPPPHRQGRRAADI